MIIGIAGNKGVGKSTLAEMLADHGFYRMSFASTLKQMARVLLRNVGMSADEIVLAEADKEAEIELLGVSYRVILQTLGTEWARGLKSDVWLLCAQHKLSELLGNVVFDDLRFNNEAEFIRERGGLVIHLVRDTGMVDDHASESGVAIAPGDVAVSNNGTLEGLFNRVAVALDSNFNENA